MIFLNAESLSVLFRECCPDIIQFLKCTNLFDKMAKCDGIIVHLILVLLM